METVKLNKYIDFEEAVFSALKDGLHNNQSRQVKLIVDHGHIGAARDAIELFQHYCSEISGKLVVSGYEQKFTEFTVNFIEP